MPAGSEPVVPAVPGVPLPVTFRPLGVRVAAIAFGALLFGVGAAMWFTFPDDVRAAFTVFQRVTVLGMGLAWLPSWLVRGRLGTGELVELLPEEGRLPYDVHALWLQTPHLPPKVRVAIDALAAELPGLM